MRQEQLAERFNVSRVPVREALKVLEAEGQVTYQAHRGYTVVELSLEELEEIYLARRLLETETTRRAVPRVDAELIQHLEDCVARMNAFAEAGDVLRYAEANWDFHLSLAERAGLPRLYRMIEVLWRISEAYRGAIFNRAWLTQAREDHRTILEACKTGDVVEAIASQNRHRDHALARIRTFINQTHP